MSAPVLLGIGVFGGLGAVARLLLDGRVSARFGRRGPYGIFVVNVLGAFLLGVASTTGFGADAQRLLATGFIGAFTTFSTWMYDTGRLLAGGRRRAGGLNVLGSLLAGLLAAWLGRRIGAGL